MNISFSPNASTSVPLIAETQPIVAGLSLAATASARVPVPDQTVQIRQLLAQGQSLAQIAVDMSLSMSVIVGDLSINDISSAPAGVDQVGWNHAVSMDA
jgi:hypothetical protein